MRIIGFNGPPRSGKDTLARHIHYIHDDEYRYPIGKKPIHYAWGQPMSIISRACILPIRKVAFDLLNRPYNETVYDEIKDQPQKLFNGESIRQFMIRLMEEHIKVKYDKQFAVKSAVSDFADSVRLYDNSILLLITDIGFQEEVDYLQDLVGPDNFLLVQTKRLDTSFNGDSRSYVKADNMTQYHNEINPLDGAKKIMTRAWQIMGWEF